MRNLSDVLADYRTEHADRFAADPAFAAWFEQEYRPVAGAWQY